VARALPARPAQPRRGKEGEQFGDRAPWDALYQITRAGQRALRGWLDEVEDEPAAGGVVFPLKLFFCQFASPRTAQAQLAAYRRFLARRLERYENLRDAPRSFDSIYPDQVLQHGITRVRATLAWIDETASAMQSNAAAASASSHRPNV